KYGVWSIVGIVITVLLYFFLSKELPKDVNRLPFFVGLIVLDLYLWSSIKKFVFVYHKFFIYLISVLYWFPVFALLGIATSTFFIDFFSLNQVFRAYLFGIILVVFIAKLVPLFFLFLNDVYRLVCFLMHIIIPSKRRIYTEEFKNSRSKFIRQIGLVTGGLFLGTLLTGMFKWAYDFKIWRHEIKLPNLPNSFNGMKIVQISDMHLGSMATKSALTDAVKMINDLNPDVIFFTGDLVNYATSEALRFKDVLRELKAEQGIYTVLGNHDYGEYRQWDTAEEKEDNMQELFSFYNDLGWRLLNNENVIFKEADGEIALVGVENWGAHPRFPKKGDLRKAMQGTEKADVKLLLSHDPSHWSSVVLPEKYDIDIAFSGHTHGMQFGIEIPGIKWSPAKYMYKRWAGLYDNKNNGKTQYLYVNRGLGVIGYPGRIGILPEITLMKLVN
ncbi:MAG: metallophosphoesterase, partial [Bacteroidota bacterium]|nr:metallophosphoesterase [Bacteroidota bacterium]